MTVAGDGDDPDLRPAPGATPLLVILKIRRSVLMPIIFLLYLHPVGAFRDGAIATVRRLRDARDRHRRVLPAPSRLTRSRRSSSASVLKGRCSTRRACAADLVLSDGSLALFLTRPISMAFAVVTIFTLLLYVPAFKAAVPGARHRRRGARTLAIGARAGRRGRGLMKIALCNRQVLGADAPHRAMARFPRRMRLGYDGLEIAPFTLAEASRSGSTAAEARRLRGRRRGERPGRHRLALAARP